jgi:tripartite-type tricarboxylate transporter receptor subunit TctC
MANAGRRTMLTWFSRGTCSTAKQDKSSFGARQRAGVVAAIAVAVHFGPGPAQAQEHAYPAKVVRFITSLATGSSADMFGRTVAEQLSRRLNQSFIVDPRPGAGGNLAAETVAKAAPDGYMLLMSSVASNAINAVYYSSLNYDFRRDFAPISKFGQIANGLFMGPAVPANSLAELSALIKAAPGKYSCASSGTGGLLHFTC